MSPDSETGTESFPTDFPNAESGELAEFIDASPTPWHATDNAAQMLALVDFAGVEVNLSPTGEGAGSSEEVYRADRGYVRRGGGLIAWNWPHSPDDGRRSPLRMIGAHTDSPNLRVRPRPDTGRVGMKQLGVEVYGGALLNSWLDLDLTLAGRVKLKSGESRLFHHPEPLLRVPQLAIHLDREVSSDGLKLNPQQHLTPIWGIGDPTPGGFRAWLADEVGCAPSDIADFDVACADTRASTTLGVQREFLAAPRLDNLCCSWGAVRTLVVQTLVDPAAAQPSVVVLNDHEEVGSTSTTGAQGAWVANTVEQLAIARGLDRSQFLTLLERSVMASADMAHATHPNYPDRHEPDHHIALGAGPVIKHNVNMRYSTSSEGAAAFRAACEQADSGLQEYSHRGDLPCGSTIGPVSAARLGVEVVDVGMPQLSMHSARELMACADVPRMLAAFAAWIAPAAPLHPT